MRRPVSVKSVFHFHIRGFFRLSRAASVAILPSALFCERLFARCKLGVLNSAGAATCESTSAPISSTGAGPGLGRSHLNSAVELGSFVSTSRPRRFPLRGCCAVAHKLLRSPTVCAAARPTCVPPQPPLASWHSFLRARLASVPSAADRCLVQRVPECSAPLAPSAFLDNGLLLC